jgi:hypothetical protein
VCVCEVGGRDEWQRAAHLPPTLTHKAHTHFAISTRERWPAWRQPCCMCAGNASMRNPERRGQAGGGQRSTTHRTVAPHHRGHKADRAAGCPVCSTPRTHGRLVRNNFRRGRHWVSLVAPQLFFVTCFFFYRSVPLRHLLVFRKHPPPPLIRDRRAASATPLLDRTRPQPLNNGILRLRRQQRRRRVQLVR